MHAWSCGEGVARCDECVASLAGAEEEIPLIQAVNRVLFSPVVIMVTAAVLLIVMGWVLSAPERNKIEVIREQLRQLEAEELAKRESETKKTKKRGKKGAARRRGGEGRGGSSGDADQSE